MPAWPGPLEQQHQHAPADAAAAHVPRHAEVEHVRLAGAHRHDAVADDLAVRFRRRGRGSRRAGSRGRCPRSRETGRRPARRRRPPATSARHHRAELHQPIRWRLGPGIGVAALMPAVAPPRSSRLNSLPREHQVLPGLALLARAAQQVGRMIGDDQRPRRAPKRCTWPRSLRERRIGARAGSAPRCARPRAISVGCDQLDLPLAGSAAGRRASSGLRVAVARRPALEHVGDVHVLARAGPARAASTSAAGPARPTNGSPCRSSSAPGASPMTIQSALAVADAEHRLRARRHAVRSACRRRPRRAARPSRASAAAAAARQPRHALARHRRRGVGAPTAPRHAGAPRSRGT